MNVALIVDHVFVIMVLNLFGQCSLLFWVKQKMHFCEKSEIVESK
jgi:hypothetical protein